MGHNKSSFLSTAVEHIDITSFDARPIIDSMSKMSFTSREAGNAAKIFNEMVSDKDCTIFLLWQAPHLQVVVCSYILILLSTIWWM